MSSPGVAQHWLPYVLLLAIVAVVLHQLSREPSLYTGWPPRTDSAPAQIQARELAVKPGEKFRGRGVVLLLMDKKEPAVWGEFFHMLYFKHRVAFGNDLMNDAEAADVPIANHYAHWVSPPMLALFAAAFYRPEDPIDRASATPRAYRPNLARLLGVALVVSDQPLPGETELYRGSAVDRPLYLHRVTGANLGQYSPTRTVVAASAEKILDQLLAKDFDGRNLAVLEKPLAHELVPAEGVTVSFHKGPIIRVTARSRGTSLLVLPLDYSHCLEVVGRGVEQVLPVNLSQTGVVIGGEAAFEITYRYGLVKGPGCRKQDLERIKLLKLENAASGRLFRDSRPKSQTSSKPSLDPSKIVNSSPLFESPTGWSAGFALAKDHGEPGVVVGPGSTHPNVFAQSFASQPDEQFEVVARASSVDKSPSRAAIQINWHGEQGKFISFSKETFAVTADEGAFRQTFVAPAGARNGVLYVVPGGSDDLVRYTEMSLGRLQRFGDFLSYRFLGVKGQHVLAWAATFFLLGVLCYFFRGQLTRAGRRSRESRPKG